MKRDLQFLNSRTIFFLFAGALFASVGSGDEGKKEEIGRPDAIESAEAIITKGLSKIPKSYRVSYLIHKDTLKQVYRVDFKKTRTGFWIEKSLVKGRPFRIEGREIVFFDPERPILKIVAFDGVKYQIFSQNSGPSRLQIATELNQALLEELYWVFLENPIYNPVMNYLSVVPVGHPAICKLVLEIGAQEKEIPSASILDLLKQSPPEEAPVPVPRISWGESYFPIGIEVSHSDDSIVNWRIPENAKVNFDATGIQIPDEIEVIVSNRNKKDLQSAESYRIEYISGSFGPITNETQEKKFEIPTSSADVVIDRNLGQILKHP